MEDRMHWEEQDDGTLIRMKNGKPINPDHDGEYGRRKRTKN